MFLLLLYYANELDELRTNNSFSFRSRLDEMSLLISEINLISQHDTLRWKSHKVIKE